MSEGLRVSPQGSALRACIGHMADYLLNTLIELLLRALCSAPFVYVALGGLLPGVHDDHQLAVAILLSLPLWILFVLPLRYRLGGRLTGWLQVKGPDQSLRNYPRWLMQTLTRLLLVLPFILPLIAVLVAYYYYAKMTGFTDFFGLLNGMGGLVGGNFVHGMGISLLIFLLCVALAFYGWRRLMVFYYLPTAPVSYDARRRREIRSRRLRVVILRNFLVLLPAIALLVYSAFLSDLKGDMASDALGLLNKLVQFSLSVFNLRDIGIWLVLLYLPFVLWRKTALAAAIHQADLRA